MDNKLKILKFLGKNIGKEFTMLELSKETKISYATFYRTIHAMKDLVNMKVVGKSKILSLNTNNAITKSYLTISSDEEKNEFLKKHSIISKIYSEFETKDIIILFGSYAKGTQRENSDIDLLIINKKGDKSMSFSKYEIVFKKKINPIFVTNEEFKEMLEEKSENVGKQALKAHIILNNPESFWGNVLNGQLQKII
jgi:predicted nucleotidyltransferase